jgi:hypothetical protein
MLGATILLCLLVVLLLAIFIIRGLRNEERDFQEAITNRVKEDLRNERVKHDIPSEKE